MPLEVEHTQKRITVIFVIVSDQAAIRTNKAVDDEHGLI